MCGYTMKATVAPTANATTLTTTRRRSSRQVLPQRHGLRRGSRRAASERESQPGDHGGAGRAGQFMLGSSGTAGKAPGPPVPTPCAAVSPGPAPAVRPVVAQGPVVSHRSVGGGPGGRGPVRRGPVGRRSRRGRVGGRGAGPAGSDSAGSALSCACSWRQVRSCSSARRSRKANGERTASATSWVGGRSGKVERTSLSIRLRHLRRSCHAACRSGVPPGGASRAPTRSARSRG